MDPLNLVVRSGTQREQSETTKARKTPAREPWPQFVQTKSKHTVNMKIIPRANHQAISNYL